MNELTQRERELDNLRSMHPELVDIVEKLSRKWDAFYESIFAVEVTIGSLKLFIPFLEDLKRLKEYAGILK